MRRSGCSAISATTMPRWSSSPRSPASLPGTFYLYFDSKKAIFDELVRDLNRRVRHAMKEGSSQGTTRLEAEVLGFEAYFRFTAEHPALYRIIRQAEFVSPEMLRYHYDRLSRGYIEALRAAVESGEIGELDPEVAAYALMGMGELIGMRWILWGDGSRCPKPSATSSSGSSAASSRPRTHEARRARRDRFVPAGAVDDRCGDRGGSGIPEQVIVEKFGLRGKHIAAPDEHVSDLSVAAARALLDETAPIRRRSTSSSTSARCGATTRCGRSRRTSRTDSGRRTRSRSSTTTSRTARRSQCVSRVTCCGRRRSCRTILVVAACRESYLLDYENARSRFMFNFGDGAVAGLSSATPAATRSSARTRSRTARTRCRSRCRAEDRSSRPAIAFSTSRILSR